jgi:glycosyltransferase involved in cell wall biosynthesis
MRVFVVTYGRAGRQVTWRNLPPSIQQRATLLVDAAEAESHGGLPVTVLPQGLRGIGAVRQWAIDNAGDDKVLMMDDDLRFVVRRTDEPTKLRQPEPGEIDDMFKQIEVYLDHFPLVGVASREGANNCTDNMMKNTRVLRLLAYRTDVLTDLGIRFDRIPVMEDFDVALQLLRAGHENIVLNLWAHNQEGSGKEGGCSTYRTMEMQAQAARRLAELHPGLVRVVEKETKTAWGGGLRTDVQIYWKRALNRT